MKIAVTGASGFIGSAIIPRLRSDGHEVEPINRDLVYEEISADMLIDLAWAGSAGRDRGNHLLQTRNAETANERVKRADIAHYVGVGTITEVELDHRPHLGAPLDDALVYATGKTMARSITSMAASFRGISHTWLRLGNIVDPSDSSGRFLTTAVDTLLSGKAMNLGAGGKYSDFILLSDALDQVSKVVRTAQNGDLFYVGGHSPERLSETVQAAAVGLGLDPVEFVKSPSIATSVQPSEFLHSGEELGVIPFDAARFAVARRDWRANL